MNRLTLQPSQGVSAVRRSNRRTVAKQLTRQKILNSARSLFVEKGYDGATIREIASAAGVSSGAVFNSFADKFEVFAEIVDADREAIYDVMRAVAAGDTATETLRLMFDAGCRLALQNLKLLQCAVSVSWSPALGAELRGRVAPWPVTDLLASVLSEAIEHGELARETNVPLVAQMLWDCFIFNFSQAAFSGWGSDELMTRLMDQTAILLNARQQVAVYSFVDDRSAAPMERWRRAKACL